jgi:Holliday junction resolvasome RuvABC DNA-binding subunit
LALAVFNVTPTLSVGGANGNRSADRPRRGQKTAERIVFHLKDKFTAPAGGGPPWFGGHGRPGC